MRSTLSILCCWLMCSLGLAQDNHPPAVRLVQPEAGPSLPTGTAIRYTIEVEDAEDGFSVYKEIKALDVFLDVRIGPSREAVARAFEQAEPPGKRLIKAQDCMSCHHLRDKHVGPAFVDIARRHQGAIQPIAQSIQMGSRGQWGDVAVMPGHHGLRKDQLEAMAQWIAALPEQGYVDMLTGTTGMLLIKPSFAGQVLGLQASYLDLGGGTEGRLLGTARQYFRLK